MLGAQASIPSAGLPPPPPPTPSRRGAYIVVYIINFCVLLLLTVGYVVFAEKEKVLTSTVGLAATTTTTTTKDRSKSMVMKSSSTNVVGSSMESSINDSTSDSYSSMWPATDLIASSLAGATTRENGTVSKNGKRRLACAEARAFTHTHSSIYIITKSYTPSLSLTHTQIHYTQECKAQTLGYQSMSCPYWDASAEDPIDPEQPVDYRVRYLWKKQHPADCSKANFMVKRTKQDIGFGALMRGHYAGPFAGALRSDRVFMINPELFPYSGCNDGRWTCYFEPLTNCSYEEHVVPLLEGHPGARWDWTEWDDASHKVVHRDEWGSPEWFPSER